MHGQDRVSGPLILKLGLMGSTQNPASPLLLKLEAGVCLGTWRTAGEGLMGPTRTPAPPLILKLEAKVCVGLWEGRSVDEI